MNCANHPDVEKVAFCRTCGKPLCANCTRSVHGVIYCESCLAARLEGVQPDVAAPVSGFVAASPAATAVVGAGPNPALAGVLAGFFPFGVGAVYTGQYAKGLAHLVIFTLLILGASSGSGTAGLVFRTGDWRVLLLSDYRFHAHRPGHTTGTGAARPVRAGNNLSAPASGWM